jgi:hypothetical protein
MNQISQRRICQIYPWGTQNNTGTIFIVTFKGRIPGYVYIYNTFVSLTESNYSV